MWTLAGNRDIAISGIDRIEMYGGRNDYAVAHYIGRVIEDFLPAIAVVEYLSVLEEQYARLRDDARAQHGKFNSRRLRSMRHIFLTHSFDLNTIGRDVRSFFTESRIAQPAFTMEFPFPNPRTVSLNTVLGEQMEKRLDRLESSDRDYRDILSTVASLGSSIDAFKMGRIALWVALVSLFISLVAMSIADLGDNTLWTHIEKIFGK